MLQHLPASLPGEGRHRDDSDLGNEEHGPGDDGLAKVDAHPHRRRYVLALDENGVPGRRAGVRCLAVVLEAELVRDLDRLYQQQVLAALRGGAGRTAATTFAEGYHGTQLACGFLLVALHWLTGRHARCHQSAELHYLGAREFEGVEVRQQNLKRKD